MKAYRFLPRAREDARLAARYYDDTMPGQGAVFRTALQLAIDTVREHPELGQVLDFGLRRILVRRFPYSLVYGVDGDFIMVVAVAHQRRRPGYWR